MKDNKPHNLIIALVFILFWLKFVYGPTMDTFGHLARPRFDATPDETPVRNTPSEAFGRAVADKDGPPIYRKQIPQTSIVVSGPKDADGNIVPMHYHILGLREQPESYYAEDGSVKFRWPKPEGGRP